MENKNLNISSNPHVRGPITTQKIMLLVIIALIPAWVAGIIHYGINAVLLVLVTVATCVLTELIYNKLMKKPLTVNDLSAAVTGLLLGLNLPPTLPIWIAVLGGIFAILVVKLLFGGLGQNFVNPALAARGFLMISFAGKMTSFVYDGVAGATPLAIIKEGGSFDVLNLFLGRHGGTIGETCAVAILAGGIFLIIVKIIDFRIPLFYLLTVAAYTVIYSLTARGGFDGQFLLSQLLGGGLLLGAFFMATDYVTSPITHSGRIIFAIFIGLLTCTFRFFGGSAEGVSFAILIGNLVTPLIEKITVPKSFGKGAKAR
ncbi:MAG: RnfABCDGE type electron transport complex subunit D [Parasporobacterium sp.]|nr:RnfABCDGE type electron transport complex subunit D [Parasporobacterium sp.]